MKEKIKHSINYETWYNEVCSQEYDYKRKIWNWCVNEQANTK